MAAATAVPTLSQIQAWDTEHLEGTANHWTSAADTWEHSFTNVYREMLRAINIGPGDALTAEG